MGCGNSTASKSIVTFGNVADFHRKYKLGTKLGEGAFGQVRTCHTSGDKDLAVKILDVCGNGEAAVKERLWQAFVDEVNLWKTCCGDGNAYVVHLAEAYEDRKFAYIVMEKCKGSVLDQFLKESSNPSEWDILGAFCQMFRAVQHVHSVGIVHRDIKPPNFLAGGEDGHEVKICDFGLAAAVTSKPLKGHVGTPPFMSPEMVLMQPYDTATDVWSLGVLAYLLFFGEFPHEPVTKSPQTMKKAIANNSPAARFAPIANFPSPPPGVTEFLRMILVRDPKLRPSCTTILQTPLMSETAQGDSMFSPRARAAESVKTRSNIRRAMTRTLDFKLKPDPTQVRNVDEILLELQNKWGGKEESRFHKRRPSMEADVDCMSDDGSFSGTASKRSAPRSITCNDAMTLQKSLKDEGVEIADSGTKILLERRDSRINSHGGEVNIAPEYKMPQVL